MAVWVWMMLKSEIWIRDECQVNILLLSTTTIIHSWIVARKETWKPFPSSFFLISRSPERIFSITIAHLFSFVSPLLSPFNPFSFPPRHHPQFPLQRLSFQPNLSIFPQPFQQLLNVLCLTSSTCLSSLCLFFQPSAPTLIPSEKISLLLGYFLFLFLAVLLDPVALALGAQTPFFLTFSRLW